VRRVAPVVLLWLCAVAFFCLGTTDSLRDDSGATASEVTMDVSQAVRVTSWDTALFPTRSPNSGSAQSFTFSGGELTASGRSRVSWAPSSDETTAIQWEAAGADASSESAGKTAAQAP
jgi:hypothetical protein